MAIVMRAYMHYDVRPSDEWTCNIEMDYDGAIDAAEVEIAALSMAAGLADILLTNVVIDRIVASTWLEDSAPYNPSSLRVIPIGINGTKDFLLTKPVDDDLVLFIRKTVSTGRSGKILLRGVLTTAEINVNSGSWYIVGSALSDIEDLVGSFFTNLSTQFNVILIGRSLLSITYPACAEGVKQVPIRNYTTIPVTRFVSGLVVVGITERQDTQ